MLVGSDYSNGKQIQQGQNKLGPIFKEDWKESLF